MIVKFGMLNMSLSWNRLLVTIDIFTRCAQSYFLVHLVMLCTQFCNNDQTSKSTLQCTFMKVTLTNFF